jgi:hypothetical protein
LEQFNQSQNAIIGPLHWRIHTRSYRRVTSTLSKDFKDTDLPFPLMSLRVAASQPITGHMYRHIFVAEHTVYCWGTSSDFCALVETSLQCLPIASLHPSSTNEAYLSLLLLLLMFNLLTLTSVCYY